MDITDIRFERGAALWAQLPSDGLPEVAFVGRSNVGKSSLLNMVARRNKLARESRTPGKTRQFNCYLVDGGTRFVDLPGYGYARVMRSERNRWGRLAERYLTERTELRLVLHLIDARHDPTESDRSMAAFLRLGVPRVVALTKADKLSGNARAASRARAAAAMAELGVEAPVVLTSAKTKRGRDELLRWIGDLAG